MYYSQAGEDIISKPYEGRLKAPTYPTTSNASITISNMQVSDAGAYTCEVHNFPDVNGKTEATIIVNILGKFCFYIWSNALKLVMVHFINEYNDVTCNN